MAADTYVISIYRHSNKSTEKITGLAERTGSGERKAFSTSGELWEFLSDKTSPSRKKILPKQKRKKQP